MFCAACWGSHRDEETRAADSAPPSCVVRFGTRPACTCRRLWLCHCSWATPPHRCTSAHQRTSGRYSKSCRWQAAPRRSPARTAAISVVHSSAHKACSSTLQTASRSGWQRRRTSQSGSAGRCRRRRRSWKAVRYRATQRLLTVRKNAHGGHLQLDLRVMHADWAVCTAIATMIVRGDHVQGCRALFWQPSAPAPRLHCPQKTHAPSLLSQGDPM